MSHRVGIFCWSILICLTLTRFISAQDSKYVPERSSSGMMINPPSCYTLGDPWVLNNADGSCPGYESWLNDVKHWRAERRIRIGYDDHRYEIPALQWSQHSFIQPQMMVHDRYFYDPVAGKYTVDRYLDDLETRFGGIDAVLIWSTYPNMGIDNRNQLDMVASMPGGLAGVKQMVADFHRRGVRVFFPMMMWDQGTRDPNQPWPDAIAKLMAQIDADGVNGDTQDGVPLAFFQAAERINHPIVFEPEDPPHDEGVAWNLMTWGQYEFQFVPKVDRQKWLEPRHMVNISDRWNRDKNDDLQFAFFNGVGWESWENIWGIWNGITPRDAEATRRMATIERSMADFLVSPEWQPFYPANQYGVFSSRWPHNHATLWTIVNRNEYDVDGWQIYVPALDGARYFDLYHGTELKADLMHRKQFAGLSFPIEAHGFGALLQVVGEPDSSVKSLLATMKKLTNKPLASYSHDRVVLSQQIVDIPPTKPKSAVPSGMVLVPAANFFFQVEGIEIEGSDDSGVDVQYPWENSPRRMHNHSMHIDAFFMDKYPVTNQEYKVFLDATHYHPRDDLNFLKDWHDGTYPAGWGNKPVTWVSLEDARAYAAWAGKRLPHEWEWQYAAEGPESRKYPWGDSWKLDVVPLADQSRAMRPPDDVDAHGNGASYFGVMDMVGNVWQWTDEYIDDHTRAAIVRGGSYYQPQGSMWYFPQAYQNSQHGKLLLMAPSMDRSGTLGFRCLMDSTKAGR